MKLSEIASFDTRLVAKREFGPASCSPSIRAWCIPVFSEDIIEEYAAVLARTKFAFPPDEIAAVLAMFHNQGELFQPDVSGPVSSDPSDTKFLHCAQAAQAD
jgi:predicted nucleic acid-binding protein